MGKFTSKSGVLASWCIGSTSVKEVSLGGFRFFSCLSFFFHFSFLPSFASVLVCKVYTKVPSIVIHLGFEDFNLLLSSWHHQNGSFFLMKGTN